MNAPMETLERHLSPEVRPKRILALDGGGVRGALSLEYLARIESILRERSRDPEAFRLRDYFDLIAGTSTGAIIAASLAMGYSVDTLREMYRRLARDVFRPRFALGGLLRPRFSPKPLERHLRRVLGEHTRLGSPELTTGLLVVAKRFDTTSPWPLNNIPWGKFYAGEAGSPWMANSDFPLWRVVRASTAAPVYFQPERFEVDWQRRSETAPMFLDGGVSPFNNPALQALMTVGLSGYGLGWKLGPDDLLLVSVGTGRPDPERKPSRWPPTQAVRALLSMMDDAGALTETILQWLSRTPTPRHIDSEIERLDGDLLGGEPLLQYRRYDVELTTDWLGRHLGVGSDDLPRKRLARMARLDDAAMVQAHRELGAIAAREQVRDEHFPRAFDP
ncbi:MAG: patatin-like phospholipase family protein [Myxococcota bacterium]